MKNHGSKRRCILLIDHQSYWRELSRQALQSDGFCVRTLATYNQVALQACLKGKSPDLIVLGCTRVGDEEQRLIEQVLDRQQHLLVLSASLTLQIMRSLFLLGVDDIEDKPYDAKHLVKIVDQVLASIAPRNSYQAVERASVR
ncbi:MAG TPA: response regulator [Ktedonobacteraceae bacterium]|nr:response regulator [Ktedonobacteraceae bacterium]